MGWYSYSYSSSKGEWSKTAYYYYQGLVYEFVKVRKRADLEPTYTISSYYLNKYTLTTNLQYIDLTQKVDEKPKYLKINYTKTFNSNKLILEITDSIPTNLVQTLKINNSFKKPGVYVLKVKVYPKNNPNFIQTFDWVIALGNKIEINNSKFTLSRINLNGTVYELMNFTINNQYPLDTDFFIKNNFVLRKGNLCTPELKNVYYLLEPQEIVIKENKDNRTIKTYNFNFNLNKNFEYFNDTIKFNFNFYGESASLVVNYEFNPDLTVFYNFKNWNINLQNVENIYQLTNNSLMIVDENNDNYLYYDNQTNKFYKGIGIDKYIIFDRNEDGVFDTYFDTYTKKEGSIDLIKKIDYNKNLIEDWIIKINNDLFLLIDYRKVIRGDKIIENFIIIENKLAFNILNNETYNIHQTTDSFETTYYIDTNDNNNLDQGDLIISTNKLCKVINKIINKKENKIIIETDKCGIIELTLLEFVEGYIKIDYIIKTKEKPFVIEFYSDGKLVESYEIKEIE